ncbi:MAG: MmgE/PrpD family protein [Lautropia sp.]
MAAGGDRAGGDDRVGGAARAGLTRRLAEAALAVRFDALPADARRVARDCLIDWLGCCIAALDQPVGRIVADAAREEGGHPQATILGRGWQGSTAQAALVNGTLSHALDYDDVNLAVPGHLSVAIVPGLLALAEQRNASAADFAAAFVAGYEFACRVGRLVEPAHYANGFHATATIGCLGAAVACSHLLGLTSTQACHAIGIAATQAAGLKAMFGSMAKPLHAGLAAQTGLRAAQLARRGLTSRDDALECGQGFAAVHGRDFFAEAATAAPPGGFHLYGNLFKFHAACYSTHAAIEAAAALRREHSIDPRTVRAIEVIAGDGCSICNIQSPTTGLEAKFSLRACAAFSLLAMDTSGLEIWDRVSEPQVRSLTERVRVRLVPEMGLSDATVGIMLDDGRELRRTCDCGTPIADKALQSERVLAKFRSIAGPVLGARSTTLLCRRLDRFEAMPDFAEVFGILSEAA